MFVVLSLRSWKTILVKIIKSQQNSLKYCFARFCLNFLPMPHKTGKQLLLWWNYIYSYCTIFIVCEIVDCLDNFLSAELASASQDFKISVESF